LALEVYLFVCESDVKTWAKSEHIGLDWIIEKELEHSFHCEHSSMRIWQGSGSRAPVKSRSKAPEAESFLAAARPIEQQKLSFLKVFFSVQ